MLRLTSSVLHCFHKSKVMSLAYLTRKAEAQANKPSFPSISQGLQEKPKGDNLHSQAKQSSRFSLFQEVLSSQSHLSKSQLEINHQIKIEIKATNLYYLHKVKRSEMTSKNLINLLIKVLELRRINPHEGEQTEKFDRLMTSISKKINNFTPEDMIRFLFSLKKIKMNPADVKRIYPFILSILEQFTQRSKIIGTSQDSIYNSFDVISIQSNLKLIYSLRHLHLMTGSEFQPVIIDLIKMSLSYFHTLVKQFLDKSNPANPIKKMRISFYFGLIKIAGSYDLPVQTIIDFVKIVNFLKKLQIVKREKFIELAGNLMNIPVVIHNCRGNKIKDYPELFQMYKTISEQFERPTEMIKISPYAILTHLKNINNFTDQQLSLLQFKELKQKTLHQILTFTCKTYQKYWNKDYLTHLQKSTVESWVFQSFKLSRQLLASILIQYHQLIQQKKIASTNEFNKLINICIESFSEQTFCTQAAIIYIALQKNFKNISSILDIFLNVAEQTGSKKEFKQIKYFKKHQGVQIFASLFQYWPEIVTLSKFTFDSYRDGTFTKMLLVALLHLQNTDSFSYLLAKRITVEKQFLPVFIKKYQRVSLQNRTLGTVFTQQVQQDKFKKDLEQVSLQLNSTIDNKKLSPFYTLKYTIRQKIKRSLLMFKFFIQMMEYLNRASQQTENVTQMHEFKEIFSNFNEEISCLFYRELFTVEICRLISEITDYLITKEALYEDCKLHQIWQQMIKKGLNASLTDDQKILNKLSEKPLPSAKPFGVIKEEEELDANELDENDIESSQGQQ